MTAPTLQSRLRKEAEACLQSPQDLLPAMLLLRATFLEAADELDRLEADAARYRWLQSRVGWREYHDLFGFNAGNFTDSDIDAAIDAARQREGG